MNREKAEKFSLSRLKAEVELEYMSKMENQIRAKLLESNDPSKQANYKHQLEDILLKETGKKKSIEEMVRQEKNAAEEAIRQSFFNGTNFKRRALCPKSATSIDAGETASYIYNICRDSTSLYYIGNSKRPKQDAISIRKEFSLGTDHSFSNEKVDGTIGYKILQHLDEKYLEVYKGNFKIISQIVILQNSGMN